jgi:hypothetical protein
VRTILRKRSSKGTLTQVITASLKLEIQPSCE